MDKPDYSNLSKNKHIYTIQVDVNDKLVCVEYTIVYQNKYLIVFKQPGNDADVFSIRRNRVFKDMKAAIECYRSVDNMIQSIYRNAERIYTLSPYRGDDTELISVRLFSETDRLRYLDDKIKQLDQSIINAEKMISRYAKYISDLRDDIKMHNEDRQKAVELRDETARKIDKMMEEYKDE